MLLTKKDVFDHTAHDFQRAVELYGLAHNSDPFARNRISLHMRKGLIFPSEVIKDCSIALEARETAKRYAVDYLS